MMRILEHRREPTAQFPQLLPDGSRFADEYPVVAQSLETYELVDETDSPRAVVGVESWVSRVGWVSLEPSTEDLDLVSGLAFVSEFAYGALGLREVLGYTLSDTERETALDRLGGELVGEITVLGHHAATLVRFQERQSNARSHG